MSTMRRAPPRSKVIQSLDEFRIEREIELAGQPGEWIAEEVAPIVEREAMERAALERWAQDAYQTKAQRPYVPTPQIED